MGYHDDSTTLIARPDIQQAFNEFDLAANMQNGFIGTSVFGNIAVNERNGDFFKIEVEELLQDRDPSRAPGSPYKRGDWNFVDDSYFCREYGWEEPVDDANEKIYATIDHEMVAAMRALWIVQSNFEKDAASKLFDVSYFSGQTGSVTNEWDDATNATPISDIKDTIDTIETNCGITPNTLVINRKVFRNLRYCDEVKENIAATGAGSPIKATDITVQMLAEVFDIPKIYVANSFKNTANKGQDASFSRIWSDEYAWVGVTSNSLDFRDPCIGRTMNWEGDGGAEPIIESYKSDEVRSEIIRVRNWYDIKRFDSKFGYLLSNITS
jgi:hypothetical protein